MLVLDAVVVKEIVREEVLVSDVVRIVGEVVRDGVGKCEPDGVVVRVVVLDSIRGMFGNGCWKGGNWGVNEIAAWQKS